MMESEMDRAESVARAALRAIRPKRCRVCGARDELKIGVTGRPATPYLDCVAPVELGGVRTWVMCRCGEMVRRHLPDGAAVDADVIERELLILWNARWSS